MIAPCLQTTKIENGVCQYSGFSSALVSLQRFSFLKLSKQNNVQITYAGIHHYRFLQEQNFTKIDKIAPKENNIITMQRYFFVLEILDKQAFNQAPFNPVLFLSVLRNQ